MNFPQDWEGIAQDRQRDWEKEMKYRNLLAQLPEKSPRWRRWMGIAMVLVGTVLMRWGERISPPRRHECVSTVG